MVRHALRFRRRAITVVILGCLASFLVLSWLAARVVLQEWSYLHPPRRPLAIGPAATKIATLRAIEFPAGRDETVRGWYCPSRNGAGIVLTHGTMGSRVDVLDEMRVLEHAGFGVLAFDWPGHGESGGAVEWGASERSALYAAVEWISSQPEISKDRIGALGISMGGYVVAQVAVHSATLRAVAVVGTPSDATALTRHEYRSWGTVAQWFAERVDGFLFEADDQKAIWTVSRLGRRPLLVVHGSADPIVPLEMARQLYAATRGPKQLYVVPGAGHGNYASVQGSEYHRRIVDFFSQSLHLDASAQR